MGDTKKLATLATLEKLRKVGHIRKSVSHLEKWATVGIMGHPWKTKPHKTYHSLICSDDPYEGITLLEK